MLQRLLGFITFVTTDRGKQHPLKRDLVLNSVAEKETNNKNEIKLARK